MHERKLLKQVQKVEHVGCISRRLSMLLAFMVIKTFANTAKTSCCDRRTVAMWHCRFVCAAKSFHGIRQALSDKPRSGRPPKIDRKILDKARRWCEGRAFTPVELHDKLEEMSGKNISMSQVRRYAREWGYSRKKTQPIMVNRTPIEEVNKWRASLYQKIARYTKMGYTIVTQDESHFKDAAMSAKYWAKRCLRIFMLWSGGFHRFSMICSMTQDGRQFFNHCQTLNTVSFLEHIDKVYREVGKMVLILDRASWHTSKNAEKFFAERDIIVLWYPIGHPYLNPVEEVWSVLKRAMNHSIRYADKDAHLAAVYEFIRVHKFDYDFKKFWKREPPKGIMRPFIKMDGPPNPDIVSHQVSSKPAQKQ